jgi:transglutaminase-like putative cysteine protease
MIAVSESGRQKTSYRRIEASLIEQWLALLGWACEWNSGAQRRSILEARRALARLVNHGLAYAQSECGAHLYDPAEVLSFVKMVDLNGQYLLWQKRFVETGRNLVREFHSEHRPSEPPPPPNLLPPKNFRVRLSREFYLGDIEPGRRLLLRLPVPLVDRGLYDLKIVTLPPTASGVEISSGAGGLEWRLAAGLQRSITLSADYTFTANPTVGDPEVDLLSAEMRDLYTRPSEGLIQVSPRIAALAKHIAGPGPDCWRQLRRIWDFFFNNLIGGLVYYEQIGTTNPGEWVLDNGLFDCQLGCALLVSFCRSLKIPARLASGYLLYSAAPNRHYWAEIYVAGRGWVPADLACWDLSVRGQHEVWRNYFFGALDYRFKTEILPRHFTGLSTIRLGTRWQIVQLPIVGGSEARFLSLDTGHSVYCDRVVILSSNQGVYKGGQT